MINNEFYKDLLNKPEKLSNLDFEVISRILKSVISIFEKENLLLEFNTKSPIDDVYVIGDIHGNFKTLLKLIELIRKNNPKLVIFLGDIVDRGPHQLECLLFILILKILHSQKYYLIRGNHETAEINKVYGFFQDFMNRFHDRSKFNEIVKFYDVLPLCAVVNSRILCLHGGIPQDTGVLKKIKGVQTKNIGLIFKSIVFSLFQIMWNDPKDGLNGFTGSFRGEGIKYFGEDVFNIFMRRNEFDFLIRAHECFPEGYRWFFNKKLLSIFSSENYRGRIYPNPASYAIIRDNLIIPKLLEL
ncbi:MAG: metallophosphoesterase [Candidatus Thorarchaeota archaeon]